jgi:hypothetical protein
MAVLQRAAKPPVDLAGRSAADDLAVTFEPDFMVASQVRYRRSASEAATQMQRRGALLNVDVHHHSGVMPVRPAGHLGVPPCLHQAHERLDSARQRRRDTGCRPRSSRSCFHSAISASR